MKAFSKLGMCSHLGDEGAAALNIVQVDADVRASKLHGRVELVATADELSCVKTSMRKSIVV